MAKLTDLQINAAIATLAAWSSKPFSDEERAGWRLALRSWDQGEFEPATAAHAASPHGNNRPTIGDLNRYREHPAPAPTSRAFAPGPDTTWTKGQWQSARLTGASELLRINLGLGRTEAARRNAEVLVAAGVISAEEADRIVVGRPPDDMRETVSVGAPALETDDNWEEF